MPPLEDIDLPTGDGQTIHLNPAAEFWPNILLPGDPARAMAIATDQMEQPRMFNHRRGLWGYSGKTPQGLGFVVQATGMGGPSAAIVCEELAQLGAQLFVRVGTCGAIDPELKLGDLIVARAAVSCDGTSRDHGVAGSIEADPKLTDALAGQAKATDLEVHDCAIATMDLFYDPGAEQRHAEALADGARAIEMEAATIFAVGARHAIPSACLLAVTDELWDHGKRKRLTHEEVTDLGLTLGQVATSAVASLQS